MKLCEVLRKIETNIPFRSIGAERYDHDIYAMDRYAFEIGDSLIIVNFFVNDNPSEPYKNYFLKTFDEIPTDIMVADKQMKQIGGSYIVEFDRNGDYGLTGGGSAAPIIATVAKIIEVFVHKHKVKELVFTAKESSRVRFYDHLVKDLAPKIGFHGYRPDSHTYYLANMN